jgi:hypothetical protein
MKVNFLSRSTVNENWVSMTLSFGVDQVDLPRHNDQQSEPAITMQSPAQAVQPRVSEMPAFPISLAETCHW